VPVTGKTSQDGAGEGNRTLDLLITNDFFGNLSQCCLFLSIYLYLRKRELRI